MNKKCAIITGGSRGIGRAICTKLAEETDYHILINYQSNKEAALETLESIQNLGKTGEIIKFDVTNHQEVKTALEQWGTEPPGLDGIGGYPSAGYVFRPPPGRKTYPALAMRAQCLDSVPQADLRARMRTTAPPASRPPAISAAMRPPLTPVLAREP